MKSVSPYNEDDYLAFFKAGQERGLAWFFELYYPALVSFAQGYVKQLPVAEDIAGEAFVKLWQRQTTFESHIAIRAFLYVVVRNACISHIRKYKRNDVNKNVLIENLHTEDLNALQKILHNENLNKVYTALQTLPPGCGEVVRLMYIEGKNYKEIAAELNLSINTIRNHRSRAIMLLKKKLIPVLIFLCLIG